MKLANPITSVLGILIFSCPIVSSMFPELKPICDKVIEELVGLGFIASADGRLFSKKGE